MLDFIALAQQCAPQVHPVTMAAVSKVESGYNPYAIGVVGGRLERQPRNKEEALATIKALDAAGWNFSVGTAQVNKHNFKSYGLDAEAALDPCANLRAGAAILQDCYTRALPKFGDSQAALQAAFSCYYSGNFSTGFRPDFKGQPSYVNKVLASAQVVHQAVYAAQKATAIKASAPPAKASIPAQAKASVPAVTVPPTTAAIPVKVGTAPAQPQASKTAPVELQAEIPAKPRHSSQVPAKYDGFTRGDNSEFKRFNGYDSEVKQ